MAETGNSDSSYDSYDSELFRDDEDYELLMKLSEIEREKELFRRSEKRKIRMQRRHAKEAVLSGNFNAKKIEGGTKTKIATGQILRNAKVTEKNISKAKDHFLRRSRELLREMSGERADFEIVRKCHLRRDGMAKIFKTPFMEKYVTGMFVKISSGIDELGNHKYFLAQIEDVKPHTNKYKFASSLADKELVIRRGVGVKTCRFDLLSNSPLTKIDFKEWEDALKNAENDEQSWFHAEIRTERFLDRKSFEAEQCGERLAKRWVEATTKPLRDTLLRRLKQAETLRANYFYRQKKSLSQSTPPSTPSATNLTRQLAAVKSEIAKAAKNPALLRRLTQKAASLERLARNDAKRKSPSTAIESEAIIRKMTKTWADFENASAAGKAQEDIFKRKTTRSLVQRFGAENQRQEFLKMQKHIDSLRSQRSNVLQKAKEEVEQREGVGCAEDAMKARGAMVRMAASEFAKGGGEGAARAAEGTVFGDPVRNFLCAVVGEAKREMGGRGFMDRGGE